MNLTSKIATMKPATPQNTKIARQPNMGNKTKDTNEAKGVPQLAIKPTQA